MPSRDLELAEWAQREAAQMPRPSSAEADLLRRVLRPHLTSERPARAPGRRNRRAA